MCVLCYKKQLRKMCFCWSTMSVSHVEPVRKHYLLCSSPCSPDGTVRHSSMWPWRRRRTSPPIRKPANNRAGEQKNREEKEGYRPDQHQGRTEGVNKFKLMDGGSRKQANWLRPGFTLSYFTARTDGSHTPQRLLEGCIHMEAAVAIGEMLHIPQEEKTK